MGKRCHYVPSRACLPRIVECCRSGKTFFRWRQRRKVAKINFVCFYVKHLLLALGDETGDSGTPDCAGRRESRRDGSTVPASPLRRQLTHSVSPDNTRTQWEWKYKTRLVQLIIIYIYLFIYSITNALKCFFIIIMP